MRVTWNFETHKALLLFSSLTRFQKLPSTVLTHFWREVHSLKLWSSCGWEEFPGLCLWTIRLKLTITHFIQYNICSDIWSESKKGRFSKYKHCIHYQTYKSYRTISVSFYLSLDHKWPFVKYFNSTNCPFSWETKIPECDPKGVAQIDMKSL